MDIHKADYGFVRNFLGLWPLWLLFAVASCAGCWRLYAVGANEALGIPAIATALLVAAFGALVLLPAYVHVTAGHYAESFFATLEVVAKSVRTPPQKNEPKTTPSE